MCVAFCWGYLDLISHKKTTTCIFVQLWFLLGGDNGSRTHDLYNAIVAL
jgi:hypothetical protein